MNVDLQQHDREPEIRLREASAEDAQHIVRTWIECLGNAGYNAIPTEGNALDAFRARIENPEYRSRLWVATVGPLVVGWQGLADFGPTQIIRAALSSTYIAPNWHRKGVGRRLLLRAMQYADESGLHYVLGWIRRDNIASTRLVLSLGWALVGGMPRSARLEHAVNYYAYAASNSRRDADSNTLRDDHE
jgi:L-amino acid N-acyltransferase YncA